MSSEERDLPASQKKLRKAREKGQVASSKDLPVAAGLIVAVMYLNGRFGDMFSQVAAVWSAPVSFKDGALEEAIRITASSLASIGMNFLLPLFGAVIVAAFASDMVMKRGLVIAIEGVMPKLDRIDPFQGFGKLFKINKLIDLVKGLIKLTVLGVGGTLALSGFLNQLMWVPICGVSCAGFAWEQLVKLLAGLSITIYAINGVVDMKLQTWLFLRSQRQTKTERKLENKEQNQSPEIKRAVRQQANAGKGERKGGVEQAIIVIGDSTVAIGVRFVAGEMPAPMCVCKGFGAGAKRIIREADKLGIPIHSDTAFATNLAKQTKVSGFLPPPSYGVMARIFKEHKVI